MVFFLSPVVSDYRLIFGFDIAGDGWLELFGYLSYPEMIASEVGFFFYCFLPLLPLVALSVGGLEILRYKVGFCLFYSSR